VHILLLCRYSEFEALRMALEKRYGVDGMLVPPLPPKKVRHTA
jgi:hypothetical protein